MTDQKTDTASIKKRASKFTFFIGIDVSRDELDFTVLKNNQFLSHQETRNSPEAINSFVLELKKLLGFRMPKALFCMEDTGYYCNHLLYVLERKKAAVCLENALQIKKSLGITRGKDDKIDSQRIAMYAWKNRGEIRLWTPKRPAVILLGSLFRLRKRLQGVSLSLKVPLAEQGTFVNRKLQQQHVSICRRSLEATKKDIERTDQAIDKLISSDDNIKRLHELITSVPCIGNITACLIIICTNEFRDIADARKFACYAGVAPFEKSSGKSVNKRRHVSFIANKEMKALLHICAMGTLRQQGEMKAYYDRKRLEGKPAMLVLNAIRNKLISRVFSCVRQGRKYTDEYKILPGSMGFQSVRAKEITVPR
ncbi:IS110 family transposase [Mucilaginibacter angelicae]|uniref:IS110 family transposase n=1 Tax=Mucilaginibacter angelicae TaxID=869718 RepID=A0ABV6L547_9SPHI